MSTAVNYWYIAEGSEKLKFSLGTHPVGPDWSFRGLDAPPIAVSGVCFNVLTFSAFRPATNRPSMSVLRLVSSATRRSPRSLAIGRRGYAEVTDKIKLSLVLPHQVRSYTSLPCFAVHNSDAYVVGNLHLHRCRTGQPVSGHW